MAVSGSRSTGASRGRRSVASGSRRIGLSLERRRGLDLDRKSDGERTALALTALDGDGSVVQLHDVADRRQADPGAADVADIAGTVEPFEYLGQVGLGNA